MATLNEKFAVLIDECAKKNNLIKADLNPIYDGLLGNEKEWKKQDTRIMWVLKEAYDEVDNGKPKGGGWSFHDEIAEADIKDENYFPFGKKRKSKNTWLNILYVSYGILEEKENLENDEFCEDKQKDLDILKKISVINMSKMPGPKMTINSELQQKFLFWKDVVLEQINSYNPNIIIFGGTYEFFKDILELGSPIKEKYLLNIIHNAKFRVSAYKKDDTIYIDTYHPLRISHEGVNKILKIIADIKKK